MECEVFELTCAFQQTQGIRNVESTGEERLNVLAVEAIDAPVRTLQSDGLGLFILEEGVNIAATLLNATLIACDEENTEGSQVRSSMTQAVDNVADIVLDMLAALRATRVFEKGVLVYDNLEALDLRDAGSGDRIVEDAGGLHGLVFGDLNDEGVLVEDSGQHLVVRLFVGEEQTADIDEKLEADFAPVLNARTEHQMVFEFLQLLMAICKGVVLIAGLEQIVVLFLL